MKDLALHILDIVQNSITADASLIEIIIEECISDDVISITIRDNGHGMDSEMLVRVTDPYTTSRTTRKVGLGLPLLKQSAEQAEGTLHIASQATRGTTVTATFRACHPDTPPWGDLPGVIILLVSANPSIDFLYFHRSNSGEYIFDTREVKSMLEDVPIDTGEVRRFLADMIRENLTELGAGRVMEIDDENKQK